MIVWAGHSVGHGDNKRQPCSRHLRATSWRPPCCVRTASGNDPHGVASPPASGSAREGSSAFAEVSGLSREDAWRPAFRPLRTSCGAKERRFAHRAVLPCRRGSTSLAFRLTWRHPKGAMSETKSRRSWSPMWSAIAGSPARMKNARWPACGRCGAIRTTQPSPPRTTAASLKRTVDGLVVDFRSVVEAVRCAIEFESAMIERTPACWRSSG